MLGLNGPNIWMPGDAPCYMRPIDLMYSGAPACVGYYELHPYVGSWTLSEASVDPDLTAWGSKPGVTITGSGPYAIRCTTANVRHRTYTPPANGINAWRKLTLVCSPAGAQRWIALYANSTYCVIDLSDGSVYDYDPAKGSVTTSYSAGTTTIELVCNVVEVWQPAIELLDAARTGPPGPVTFPTYVGNTADGIDVTSITAEQPRLAQVDDLSLDNVGAPNGNHLVQATPASQQLLLNDFAAQNGVAVGLAEDGRTSSLKAAGATAIQSAFNGVDQAHAIVGVWGGQAAASNAIMYAATTGTGSEYLIMGTTTIGHVRDDGGTTSSKLIGNHGGVLSTPKLCCLIFKSSRAVELWVDGVLLGSNAHNALGALAIQDLLATYKSGLNASAFWGNLAIFKGDFEYSGHIRNIARGLAARWGLRA